MSLHHQSSLQTLEFAGRFIHVAINYDATFGAIIYLGDIRRIVPEAVGVQDTKARPIPFLQDSTGVRLQPERVVASPDSVLKIILAPAVVSSTGQDLPSYDQLHTSTTASQGTYAISAATTLASASTPPVIPPRINNIPTNTTISSSYASSSSTIAFSAEARTHIQAITQQLSNMEQIARSDSASLLTITPHFAPGVHSEKRPSISRLTGFQESAQYHFRSLQHECQSNSMLSSTVQMMQYQFDSMYRTLRDLVKQEAVRQAQFEHTADRILMAEHESFGRPSPGLFVMLPISVPDGVVACGEEGSKDPLDISVNQFRVYYVCNVSPSVNNRQSSSGTTTMDLPLETRLHIVQHEEYMITNPAGFIATYGVYVLNVLLILKKGVSTMTTTVPRLPTAWPSSASIPSDIDAHSKIANHTQYFEQQYQRVLFMIEYLQKLQQAKKFRLDLYTQKLVPVTSTISTFVTDQDFNLELSKWKASDLANLSTWLRSNPSEVDFNPLIRTCVDGHYIRWSCQTHCAAHVYRLEETDRLVERIQNLGGASYDPVLDKIHVVAKNQIGAQAFYTHLLAIRPFVELSMVFDYGVSTLELQKFRDFVLTRKKLVVLTLDFRNLKSASGGNKKRYEPIMDLLFAANNKRQGQGQHKGLRSLTVLKVPDEYFCHGGSLYRLDQPIHLQYPTLLKHYVAQSEIKTYDEVYALNRQLPHLKNLNSLTMWSAKDRMFYNANRAVGEWQSRDPEGMQVSILTNVSHITDETQDRLDCMIVGSKLQDLRIQFTEVKSSSIIFSLDYSREFIVDQFSALTSFRIKSMSDTTTLALLQGLNGMMRKGDDEDYNENCSSSPRCPNGEPKLQHLHLFGSNKLTSVGYRQLGQALERLELKSFEFAVTDETPLLLSVFPMINYRTLESVTLKIANDVRDLAMADFLTVSLCKSVLEAMVNQPLSKPMLPMRNVYLSGGCTTIDGIQSVVRLLSALSLHTLTLANMPLTTEQFRKVFLAIDYSRLNSLWWRYDEECLGANQRLKLQDVVNMVSTIPLGEIKALKTVGFYMPDVETFYEPVLNVVRMKGYEATVVRKLWTLEINFV